MSVLSHIGKIFKDSPMRRFFRGKQKSVAKNAAVVAEEGQGHAPENESNRSKVEWFETVKDQQLDKIKELIEKGVRVDDTDEHGWSALHIAAWNNYLSVCQELLVSGASVNIPGPGSSSPLSLAAQHGHTDVVKLLIHAQCDISQTADLADSMKVTALHLAAQYGHCEVVKLLIEAGAVVNAAMTVRGIDGVTPLHLAVQNEHLDIMDILIAAGCDVHSSTQPQDSKSETSVSPAPEAAPKSSKVMESSC